VILLMFTKKSAICTNYVHLRLFKLQFFGSMNRNRDFKNIDGLVPAGLLSIKSPLAVFFWKIPLGRNKSAGVYEGEDIAQQAWEFRDRWGKWVRCNLYNLCKQCKAAEPSLGR